MKEKRFKTKVKATDSSQITDQTIGEIIEAKIEFVVEKTRNEVLTAYENPTKSKEIG